MLPYRTDTDIIDGVSFTVDVYDDGDRFVNEYFIDGVSVPREQFHVAMELAKNVLSFFEIARVFRVDLDYVKNVFDSMS